MKHTDPSKAYQADVLTREHAHYVEKARSWLPTFHRSPDCARVPDEAVLRLFLKCLSWIHAADGADLFWFWEELLEQNGFESDRQRYAREWEEICKRSTNPLYNPSLRIQNAGDVRENETPKRDLWDPELGDGTPRLTVRGPEEQREYEKKHPILYPPKNRNRPPRVGE